ncbi:MAG: glyceraldehyde-3-phosphate dehydrogenase, partial [Bacteroidetes bacterium]|nr:glyceraldehyde-3-phosphate dehydrogenase [Bacteroidota bacterium]
MLKLYENEFNSWIDKEKKAIELINVVGKLWFDRSIELLLFRKPLFDIGSSEILAHHQYARKIVNKNISIYETLAIAQAIGKSNLAPSRIDIGRLAAEWIDTDGKLTNIEDFVIKNLGHHIGKDKLKMKSRDV